MANKGVYLDDRKEFGRHGEEQAAEFLQEKGFRVLEQNYTCKIGEIDLICRSENLLVFVEVKSRRSFLYGEPQEAVNAAKIKKIRKVASWYLTEKMRLARLFADCDMRFDVVEVKQDGEVSHIEGAF